MDKFPNYCFYAAVGACFVVDMLMFIFLQGTILSTSTAQPLDGQGFSSVTSLPCDNAGRWLLFGLVRSVTKGVESC